MPFIKKKKNGIKMPCSPFQKHQISFTLYSYGSFRGLKLYFEIPRKQEVCGEDVASGQ